MKKRIIILSAISAALLASCSIEPLYEDGGAAGTTTVTFTPDFGISDEEAATKAFAETPQITNLYLAVFNEGGKSLVEYVKADPVSPAAANGIKYTYTVKLKTSSRPRVIHFIANAPEDIKFGSDVDAVGALNYSFDTNNWTGQDAYWGYLKLDNGICGETDPGFGSLQSSLSGVKLVRNFAKIQVKTAASGSNFTIKHFWISNFPDCSTAAPYNRNARRFETAYAGYTNVSAAMEAGYEGFCPAYSGLVSLSGLKSDKLSAIACAPGTYAYTYEREKPVSDPLCIIVGGTSDLSPDTETFYKIDFRDNDGNYIPVLRNFTYTISIGTVSKVGETSVEAALNSVSSGAIDTDISLQSLKDLSNGKSRIAVSETEKVLFDSKPFELLYSFIPEVSGVNAGIVVNKTPAHWASEGYSSEEAIRAAHLSYVTIGSAPGLSGNVIDTYTIADNDEIDGYRKVSITPVPADNIIKTEVVTITGHVWNSETGLYETLRRTVNYQMRPRLDMTVTLTPDRIPMELGAPFNLTIGIDENLPKSLFTLNMMIASDQRTISPGDNTMSISSGVGADGKPTFFITKAITWEEYSSTPSVMDEDGILRKHFECPLRINTSNFRDADPSFGQGDRVVVTNEDFNPGTAYFIVGDDDLKRFKNPHLDKEYLVAGKTATLSFGMTALPDDGTITVIMQGMKPVDPATGSGFSGISGSNGVYELAVTGTDVKLDVIPTTPAASGAKFLLEDDEFYPSAEYEYNVHAPVFSDLGLKYGDQDYVIAGRQAMASFHMEYIPADGKVKIYLKNAVLQELSGTTETDGYTSYEIPVTGNDVEFPVTIAPASETETKAYFKLTAKDFTDSGECSSDIGKIYFTDLMIVNMNDPVANYVLEGKPARIDFSMNEMPLTDNVITISLTNLELGAVISGVSEVTDNEDGSYDLTLSGKHVIIEATPIEADEYASYELTGTEFNPGECSVPVMMLRFSDLKFLIKTGTDYLLSGDTTSSISFTVEQIPEDGEVTVWITDASINEGTAGTPEDGYTPYTVSVTSKTTVLGISVFDIPEYEWCDFFITAEGFKDRYHDGIDIMTRHTVEWENVKILTDFPESVAANLTDIGVYIETEHGSGIFDTLIRTISTNGSGFASGEPIIEDLYIGDEYDYEYCLKFTKDGIPYESDIVTLVELEEGTTITGKIQADN